jgi:Protein of unknown function (DUF3040)
MPLSDHEQRILDAIEKRFHSDDPDLASSIALGKAVSSRRIIAGLLLCGPMIVLALTVSCPAMMANVLMISVLGLW